MLLLFFIPLKTRTNRVWFFQDSHDSVNDLHKEVLLRVVSLLHFTLLYTKNSDALVATIRINPPKGGWVGSRSFVAPEFLARGEICVSNAIEVANNSSNDSEFELIATDPFAGLALAASSENIAESDCNPEPAESVSGGYSASFASDPVQSNMHSAVDFANLDVVDDIVFDAHVEIASEKLPKHAWETGIMKSIFSDDPHEAFNLLSKPLGFGSLASQVLAQPSESTAVESNPIVETQLYIALPIYCSAVKVKPQKDYFGELDHLWQSALEKWYRVFDYLGFPGSVGGYDCFC